MGSDLLHVVVLCGWIAAMWKMNGSSESPARFAGADVDDTCGCRSLPWKRRRVAFICPSSWSQSPGENPDPIGSVDSEAFASSPSWRRRS